MLSYFWFCFEPSGVHIFHQIPKWKMPVLYSKKAKLGMLKANNLVLCLQN